MKQSLSKIFLIGLRFFKKFCPKHLFDLGKIKNSYNYMITYKYMFFSIKLSCNFFKEKYEDIRQITKIEDADLIIQYLSYSFFTLAMRNSKFYNLVSSIIKYNDNYIPSFILKSLFSIGFGSFFTSFFYLQDDLNMKKYFSSINEGENNIEKMYLDIYGGRNYLKSTSNIVESGFFGKLYFFSFNLFNMLIVGGFLPSRTENNLISNNSFNGFHDEMIDNLAFIDNYTKLKIYNNEFLRKYDTFLSNELIRQSCFVICRDTLDGYSKSVHKMISNNMGHDFFSIFSAFADFYSNDKENISLSDYIGRSQFLIQMRDVIKRYKHINTLNNIMHTIVNGEVYELEHIVLGLKQSLKNVSIKNIDVHQNDKMQKYLSSYNKESLFSKLDDSNYLDMFPYGGFFAQIRFVFDQYKKFVHSINDQHINFYLMSLSGMNRNIRDVNSLIEVGSFLDIIKPVFKTSNEHNPIILALASSQTDQALANRFGFKISSIKKHKDTYILTRRNMIKFSRENGYQLLENNYSFTKNVVELTNILSKRISSNFNDLVFKLKILFALKKKFKNLSLDDLKRSFE